MPELGFRSPRLFVDAPLSTGEAIALETVLAGGLWLALADENQLETAILNLAVNARDAMPEGGKMTI